MNYVLSFCKITAASKIFSRNFYLPLLKPQTPNDALRTFRITGKWLLGARIQHYIPVLLNHTKKRSKKVKNYGKIKHAPMEDYVYMMPVLDPENIESHKNLANILEGKSGKGAFVYTVDDKNYNLVIDAQLEIAIRNGDVIDVLMSQGTDKILIKLKDFKKVPVEIQHYTGNGKLYKGEGTTSKEDEKFHHHGKYTMSIAKIFEDLERKEEEWEKELKRLLEKRKRQRGEGTKEWNEMVKAATANMDWKRFEKQAKRIVQYVDSPIIEYHIGMEVDDFEKTKDVDELLSKGGQDILCQLPTLQEIPDLINNMANAVLHELEIEVDDDASSQKIKKKICGAKVTLPSGKECFIVGQMIKSEEGEVFVPGQTVANEFGVEYSPGITVFMDNKATLITGLIVGDADNKNPMFVPSESTITEAGHLSFTTTKEERVKYKPRKVPVRKVIKSINQNPEDNYEEYYYDDEGEYANEMPQRRKKMIRVVKKRKIIPLGCAYDNEEEYEEEEYSEYEEVDEDEEENLNERLQEYERDNATEEVVTCEEDSIDEEPTLEQIIEEYKKREDPRVTVYREQLEEQRQMIKAIDAKITELIVNIETKTEEVKEKLEELRNLTVVQEIDPVSTASMEDATEIASKITDHLPDANVISDILLTMVRRVLTFPDKNSINIENINNPNIITNEMGVDERNRRCEKLKIALKTAMVAGNNVFKNRPQDEVSALKAIGTVLMLALQDQDKLIAELCYLMNDPLERNEICALLLKELSQKHKKNKIKVLKSIVNENESEIQDDSRVIDKLREVLDKNGDIMGPAFKKIAKNNPDILKKVIELIKADVNQVKSERFAMQTLQDAIVKAVKQTTDQDFKDFVTNAKQNEIKELINEAVAFSHVLSLNGVAHDLVKLPLNSKIIATSDKTCLTLLKRLFIIRKLAESDYGQTAALKEIRKNPEFGRTNPRIRQLIRESAVLVSNGILIKSSKQIPEKMFEEQNLVALEDFLIQKSRIDLPVLVSKNGKQAILPQELRADVLAGRIPYVLVDEDGVSNIKAVKKFFKRLISNKEKDYEKPMEEYSPFNESSRKSEKNEKWAEIPDFGKMDMREAPILMMSSPQEPSSQDQQPAATSVTPSTIPEQERLPVLVNTYGIHVVYPSEARRDVLAGRVAYIYVDDSGASVFKPKHMFAALKLNRDQKKKYEDYPCLGAHQWTLEKPSTKGIRRRQFHYDANGDEGRRQWAMNPSSRGSAGPRA